MNCSCSYNACTCKIIGIFIAVILAVVFGVLFYFGLLPNVIIALFAALIIAAVFLLLIIVGIFRAADASAAVRECFCDNIGLAVTGAVGTIIFALLALVISLVVGSFLSAIVIGLGALFFVLLLTAIICFVKCILGSICTDTVRR